MERHIKWNIIAWWINGINGEIVISGLVIMLLVTRRLQIAGTTVISSVSLMMTIGVKKKKVTCLFCRSNLEKSTYKHLSQILVFWKDFFYVH